MPANGVERYAGFTCFCFLHSQLRHLHHSPTQHTTPYPMHTPCRLHNNRAQLNNGHQANTRVRCIRSAIVFSHKASCTIHFCCVLCCRCFCCVRCTESLGGFSANRLEMDGKLLFDFLLTYIPCIDSLPAATHTAYTIHTPNITAGIQRPLLFTLNTVRCAHHQPHLLFFSAIILIQYRTAVSASASVRTESHYLFNLF